MGLVDIQNNPSYVRSTFIFLLRSTLHLGVFYEWLYSGFKNTHEPLSLSYTYGTVRCRYQWSNSHFLIQMYRNILPCSFFMSPFRKSNVTLQVFNRFMCRRKLGSGCVDGSTLRSTPTQRNYVSSVSEKKSGK